MNLVNQGLEVQVPISGTTYQAFTGTGYIALNLNTGEGGYYLSGNLHGGITVAPIQQWPPNVGMPIIDPNEPMLPPDTDPNSVYRLDWVSPNWQVGTVGQFLPGPLIVKVTDALGLPVWGATITFTVVDGGGCINMTGSGDCIGNAVPVVTNYAGYAGVWLQLGQHTNVDPVYMMNSGDQKETQAGVNTLSAVSQNNISLLGGYTAIGMPDKPAALVKTHSPSGSVLLGDYVGFNAAMVEDKYGNPVSNIQVTFAVNQWQYMGSTTIDDTKVQNVALVPEENIGQKLSTGDCPPSPTQDNVGVCGAGPGPFQETADFKGVDQREHLNRNLRFHPRRITTDRKVLLYGIL